MLNARIKDMIKPCLAQFGNFFKVQLNALGFSTGFEVVISTQKSGDDSYFLNHVSLIVYDL